MPPEAKDAMKKVGTAAALATVAGILIQVLIGAFWFGGSLAKKADVEEVQMLRRDWSLELKALDTDYHHHKEVQARETGQMIAQLRVIAQTVGAPVVVDSGGGE